MTLNPSENVYSFLSVCVDLNYCYCLTGVQIIPTHCYKWTVGYCSGTQWICVEELGTTGLWTQLLDFILFSRHKVFNCGSVESLEFIGALFFVDFVGTPHPEIIISDRI